MATPPWRPSPLRLRSVAKMGMRAATAGFLLLSLSAAGIAGCGSPRGPRWAGPPQEANEHVVVVTRVEGAPVSIGTVCALTIFHLSDSGFNCKLQLRCGDALLYGHSGSGFCHCEEGPGGFTRAEDLDDSDVDDSPRMRFDLSEGVMEVEGDHPYRRLALRVQRFE